MSLAEETSVEEASENITALINYFDTVNTKQIEIIEELARRLKAGDDLNWEKSSLLLARTFLKESNHPKFEELMVELKQYCKQQDVSEEEMLEMDSYDMEKVDFLISLLSLEIDFYVAVRKPDMVNDSLNVLLYLREVNWDPKIIAVVRECEAKVEMSKKNWQVAFEKYQQSFSDLVAIADSHAERILTYMLLADLLGQQNFDIVSKQEYQVYE